MAAVVTRFLSQSLPKELTCFFVIAKCTICMRLSDQAIYLQDFIFDGDFEVLERLFSLLELHHDTSEFICSFKVLRV